MLNKLKEYVVERDEVLAVLFGLDHFLDDREYRREHLVHEVEVVRRQGRFDQPVEDRIGVHVDTVFALRHVNTMLGQVLKAMADPDLQADGPFVILLDFQNLEQLRHRLDKVVVLKEHVRMMISDLLQDVEGVELDAVVVVGQVMDRTEEARVQNRADDLAGHDFNEHLKDHHGS